MKLIRTTTPIPIGRSSKLAIVAMAINIEWEEDFNRWKISVKDYEQIPNENLESGSDLYIYRPLIQEDGSYYKKLYFTPEEVNVLFSQFNITISPTDNFTDKFRQIAGLSGIYRNQVSPPYTINPADLELFDSALEVTP